MAVPETSPPVRVAQNNMHMIAQTLIPGDGIHKSVTGHFRHASTSDIVLAKGTSLALTSASDHGNLKTQLQQPVHANIIDVQVLHGEGPEQVSNILVTLQRLTTTKARR